MIQFKIKSTRDLISQVTPHQVHAHDNDYF